MRKITNDTCRAFINGQTKFIDNTATDGESLCLFGNEIARRWSEGFEYNFCGFPTRTTKERLNGLAELLGKGRPFHTVKGQLMRSGTPIDDEAWYIL